MKPPALLCKRVFLTIATSSATRRSTTVQVFLWSGMAICSSLTLRSPTGGLDSSLRATANAFTTTSQSAMAAGSTSTEVVMRIVHNAFIGNLQQGLKVLNQTFGL